MGYAHGAAKRSIGLLVICMMAGMLVRHAGAQTTGSPEDIRQSNTSYHSFVRPGEVTVEVLVLGTGSDGIYEVGLDTRLDQLLALSGGTRINKEVREDVTVQLFRQQSRQRVLVYEASLEDMLLATERYPSLQDGDVFVMETPDEDAGDRLTWRDAISLVSSVASLTLVAVRLFSGSF